MLIYTQATATSARTAYAKCKIHNARTLFRASRTNNDTYTRMNKTPTWKDLASLAVDLYSIVDMAKEGETADGDYLIGGNQWDVSTGGSKHSIEYATVQGGSWRAFVVNGSAVPFAGNAWLWDWLRNFAAFRSKSLCGTVHAGFYKAAKEIHSAFCEAAQQNPKQPLHVVGHSQGAGIVSLLVGLTAAKKTIPLSSIGRVCALAPPRVGGSVFHDLFTANISEADYRLYARRWDPVVYLPRRGFNWTAPKFMPCGKVTWLDRFRDADGKFDHLADAYVDLIHE